MLPWTEHVDSAAARASDAVALEGRGHPDLCATLIVDQPVVAHLSHQIRCLSYPLDFLRLGCLRIRLACRDRRCVH